MGDAAYEQRGRWALVTGASAGIGEAIAWACAARGYELVLCARRVEKLDAIAAELRATGRSVEVLPADLRKRRAAARVADALAERGIAIDLLVNNAGIAGQGAFAAMDPDMLDDLVAVNVRALTALTRALLPGMLARKRGRILNVASVLGFQPGPAVAAYAASKAYVLSLSEALAEEVRGSGVTVTALCPGLTRTEMTSDLPPRMAAALEQFGASDAVVQSPAEVAREGLDACERGDVVFVPGALNRWAMFWAQMQPRWMVRMLGGVAGRMAIADESRP